MPVSDFPFLRNLAPDAPDSASFSRCFSTVFMRAFKREFDGVVSILHGHGFVAVKSHDFEHGVNITVRLLIIRTSVGHETAFDIAGTGTASPKSLIEAVQTAIRLWENRS